MQSWTLNLLSHPGSPLAGFWKLAGLGLQDPHSPPCEGPPAAALLPSRWFSEGELGCGTSLCVGSWGASAGVGLVVTGALLFLLQDKAGSGKVWGSRSVCLLVSSALCGEVRSMGERESLGLFSRPWPRTG